MLPTTGPTSTDAVSAEGEGRSSDVINSIVSATAATPGDILASVAGDPPQQQQQQREPQRRQVTVVAPAPTSPVGGDVGIVGTSTGAGTAGELTQRRTAAGVTTRFVSRHRQELDRIRGDASHSRSYPVPHHDGGGRRHFLARHGSGDSNDEGGDGEDANGNNGESNEQNLGEEENGYDSGNGGVRNRRKGNKPPSTTGEMVRLVCQRQRNRMCFPSSSNSSSPSWHSGELSRREYWLGLILPCTLWLRTYEWRTTLLKDVVAGLTVGVMVVPQSMSYAKLAGLPVQYGLYSALVPVYAYAAFGSSRQLAVGPVAIISLLLSTGLSAIMRTRGVSASDDPDAYASQYAALAVQTSFLVGVMYIVMGICRLGFVTIFLSHAVISGFTTGAAVIIGASQLKYVVGYDIERSDRIYEILYNLFASIGEFNWKTFLMGTLSIVWLVALKNSGKRYPRLKWARAAGPLSITVIAVALVAAANLDERGIPVVGKIPRGFPQLTTSWWTPVDNFGQLFVVVVSIGIVGFMESIAIGKQLASKHKYEIDSSTELIGLGMSNFLGGMFQSYPVTGSFSRSAVNNESGAESGISGVVTATIVAFVLLFLTTVFELLPLNTLAAIVISGVLGLLDYEEAMKLWKVHKFDFFVWLTACLGTMFLGVEIGLAIAVGVSLLIVIYESAYPHTAVCPQQKQSNKYAAYGLA